MFWGLPMGWTVLPIHYRNNQQPVAQRFDPKAIMMGLMPTPISSKSSSKRQKFTFAIFFLVSLCDGLLWVIHVVLTAPVGVHWSHWGSQCLDSQLLIPAAQVEWLLEDCQKLDSHPGHCGGCILVGGSIYLRPFIIFIKTLLCLQGYRSCSRAATRSFRMWNVVGTESLHNVHSQSPSLQIHGSG